MAHHAGKIPASELPFKGLRRLLVELLEVVEALGYGSQLGEVVGGEHLAIHDGEVDLDLVEPGGVDRAVQQAEVAMAGMQRCTDATPRCEDPLSTIQKTSRAVA